MSGERRLSLLRWLSLLVVIGISVFVFSIRDQVEQFGAYGYSGIFLIALLAYATIILPAPSLAVVFAMGSVFHPLGIGIAAGSGAALGELSGYLAGFSGRAVVERMDIYEKITPWVEKHGTLTILILASIPNPFFDIVGIAAGAAKIPVKRFLFACWIGQFIKATLFAYAGAASIEWLLPN